MSLEKIITRIKLGPDSNNIGWEPGYEVPEIIGQKYDTISRLLEQGKYEIAFVHSLEIYDLMPDHPYIAQQLGVILGQLDRDNEALKIFEKLSRGNFSAHIKSDLLANIGAAHMKLGNYILAEESFHEAIKLYALNKGAFVNLGNLKIRQQKFSEAITYLYPVFEEFTQNPSPINVSAIINLIKCYKILRMNKELELAVNILKELPPEHAYIFTQTLKGEKITFYQRDVKL